MKIELLRPVPSLELDTKEAATGIHSVWGPTEMRGSLKSPLIFVYDPELTVIDERDR